jgi:hypothetical protein
MGGVFYSIEKGFFATKITEISVTLAMTNQNNTLLTAKSNVESPIDSARIEAVLLGTSSNGWSR